MFVTDAFVDERVGESREMSPVSVAVRAANFCRLWETEPEAGFESPVTV